MNTTSDLRQIEQEAARWVNRMNRPVQSQETATAFDQWIMQDPRHVESYARMQSLWQSDEFRRVLEKADIGGSLPEALNDNTPQARSWKVAGAIIAALSVILVLPVAAMLSIDEAHYAATPGQVRTWTLADGSKITLSGGTEMDVRFAPWSRSVALHRGEAFFDVAHERFRGFRVDAGDARIAVLGTAFDVDRVGRDDLRVHVFRGVVGVAAGSGRRVRVAAGQGVELSHGAIGRLPGPGGEHPGWVDGWYDAADVPLRELAARLGRMSDVPVSLADPALGELRVSGRFRISQPEQALDAVAAALDLRWRRQDGGYVISR